MASVKRLGHMLEDVRLALATAAELAVEARVARAAERLYAEAEAGGRGEHDFAAVVERVERSRTDDTAGTCPDRNAWRCRALDLRATSP